VSEGQQIFLGGNDRYEGMCYNCYRTLIEEKRREDAETRF